MGEAKRQGRFQASQLGYLRKILGLEDIRDESGKLVQ
jgi:hypothetical protein